MRSLDGWGVMTLMGGWIHPHCNPLTGVASRAPLEPPGLSAQFQGQSLVFRCSIYQQLSPESLALRQGHLSLLGPSTSLPLFPPSPFTPSLLSPITQWTPLGFQFLSLWSPCPAVITHLKSNPGSPSTPHELRHESLVCQWHHWFSQVFKLKSYAVILHVCFSSLWP